MKGPFAQSSPSWRVPVWVEVGMTVFEILQGVRPWVGCSSTIGVTIVRRLPI